MELTQQRILDKNSFLYNEPINLFFEEFRDPAPYVSILLAITQGYTKFNEIATTSKIQNHKLPKYLLVLERVNIIEKSIPITEKRIKTKTTRYVIVDNFYRFWFSFVFRNKAMIEQGFGKEVFKEIEKGLNAYIGKCFEEICRESLLTHQFTKIGKWWHKNKEIDIVGLNEERKEILFAECKWKEMIDAKKLLEELKEKAKEVKWYNKERKESYWIFAKSFKKRTREAQCVDLKDLEKLFIKNNLNNKLENKI